MSTFRGIKLPCQDTPTDSMTFRTTAGDDVTLAVRTMYNDDTRSFFLNKEQAAELGKRLLEWGGESAEPKPWEDMA